MFKRLMMPGAISGVLAGTASVIYARVYSSSLGADFSLLVQPIGIITACIIGCLLASLGYWLCTKWFKGKGEIVFNLIFSTLTIASILAVFTAKLPLEVEMPELFPGFAIPMHFFPALAFFTITPFFKGNKNDNKQD